MSDDKIIIFYCYFLIVAFSQAADKQPSLTMSPPLCYVKNKKRGRKALFFKFSAPDARRYYTIRLCNRRF